MKICTVKLESTNPISFSRYLNIPKLANEDDAQREERTWRERMHVNQDGNVMIPPMMFKKCLSGAAQYLGDKIPGRRGSTFSQKFKSGVMCFEPIILPEKKDDVEGEWLYVPSDGRPGGRSRVPKCFPVIRKWQGTVSFRIIEDSITEEVFRKHLNKAGELIGIGRFRPAQDGFYGTFRVAEFRWEDGE